MSKLRSDGDYIVTDRVYDIIERLINHAWTNEYK